MCLPSDAMCLLFSLILPFFFPFPSPRRREREAFPMSNMWFGHKKEELLEAAYGHSHRFKKSSMSTLSIPVCSQGQSQIPHEGKPFVDGMEGCFPLPTAQLLADMGHCVGTCPRMLGWVVRRMERVFLPQGGSTS